MNFRMWDTLFNLLLMIFWLEIWHSGRGELALNRILAPLTRIQKTTIGFLKPVLPFLPDKIIAAVALVFLIVFRGLAVPDNVHWSVSMGFAGIRADGTSIASCLAISAISFAVFLFKLWGISLIYVRTRREASFNNNTDALFQVSQPFSDIAMHLRPLILLLYGMLLAWLIVMTGLSAVTGSLRASTAGLATGLRLFIISLSGWVAILPVIQNCLLLFIIGSIVSLFTASHALSIFCREWIDFLIGPLRRYPIRIGMFDLTPLVFMFALGFLHAFLYGTLARTFQTI